MSIISKKSYDIIKDIQELDYKINIKLKLRNFIITFKYIKIQIYQ